MQKADLNHRDSYLAKLYIHQLLLKGEYQEAWESIMLCHRIGVRSFTSAAVHDYIRFLIHYPVGKVALKNYLNVLEQFRATGEKGLSAIICIGRWPKYTNNSVMLKKPKNCSRLIRL